MWLKNEGEYWMTEVFYRIVNMSISASWLIAAVIILRLFLKKVPRRIVCCLWALVALRLVCPFTVESRLSLIPDVKLPAIRQIEEFPETSGDSGKNMTSGTGDNAADSTRGMIPDEAGSVTGNAENLPGNASLYDVSGDSADNLSENTSSALSGNVQDSLSYNQSAALPDSRADVSASSDIGISTGKTPENKTDFTKTLNKWLSQIVNGKTFAIMSVIWLAGVILLFTYAIITYIRLRNRTMVSVNIGENIYLCDDVDSPFILGVFNTKIFIPTGLADEDREYVLAHERAHLRRRDNLWKPLGYVILAVYWFNPLSWIAYIFMCRDIEVACDEKVIADKDAEYKRQYATTLLNCSVDRKHVTACPLAFGEAGVKQRIKAVLNYKKPAFWVVILAAAVCIAVAVGFMTSPSSNGKLKGEDSALNESEGETQSEDETQSEGEPQSQEAESENSSQPESTENIVSIDYDGWHIEFDLNGIWAAKVDGDELKLFNRDNYKRVSLVHYDESDNPISYNMRAGSSALSDWNIEELTGSLTSKMELEGNILRSRFNVSEGDIDYGGAYEKLVIYSTAGSDTIWYVRFSPEYFSAKSVDYALEKIKISYNNSVDDENETISYYDRKLSLSVYEQYKLAENKFDFLRADVSDDDGNFLRRDGGWMHTFDLLTDELETGNTEIYDKLKNPVSSAQTLLGIDYVSYMIYNYDSYGVNSHQIVEFTLSDGSKRAIAMENRGTSGLWCPLFEEDVDSDWYHRVVSRNEYMNVADADSLRQVTKVYSREYYNESGDEFLILGSVPDSDIVLYGFNDGEGMIIRDGEHIIPVWLGWISMYMGAPKFSCGDYDNDGMTEYAIVTLMQTGTGVSCQEFYIIDADYSKENSGEAWYSINEYRNIFDDVDKAVDYSVDDTGKIITVMLNGETAGVIDLTQKFESLKEYDEILLFTGIYFGSDCSFEERDGAWYFKAQADIMAERDEHDDKPRYIMNWGCPYNMTVSGRIVYDENEGFSLSDMGIDIEKYAE